MFHSISSFSLKILEEETHARTKKGFQYLIGLLTEQIWKKKTVPNVRNTSPNSSYSLNFKIVLSVFNNADVTLSLDIPEEHAWKTAPWNVNNLIEHTKREAQNDSFVCSLSNNP